MLCSQPVSYLLQAANQCSINGRCPVTLSLAALLNHVIHDQFGNLVIGHAQDFLESILVVLTH